MIEEEKKRQADALLKAVEFSRKLVEKDILKLEEEIKNLEDAFYTLTKHKIPNNDNLSDNEKTEAFKNVDKNFYQTYLEKKNRLDKLKSEKNEIDNNYLFQVNLIKKQKLSKEKESDEIIKIIAPFFKKYNISNSEALSLEEGESNFERIINSTETYKIMSDKIDELEKKAAEIEIKNAINPNKKIPNIYQEEVKSAKDDRRILTDREKIMNQIVMLKQNEAVEKRINKISKLEAKRDYRKAKLNGVVFKEEGLLNKVKNKLASKTTFFDNLNKVLVENYDNKINELKTKEIKIKGANRILMEQKVVSMFTKKRYDKDGNFDYRHWATRRLSELKEKSGLKEESGKSL
ncbi:MAG: hypothetical protein IKE73_05440 [Bacilli bacterium]|nr:hypothetical protein [Bacilli bacterium]